MKRFTIDVRDLTATFDVEVPDELELADAVRFLREGLQGWNPHATLRGTGGVADLVELSIEPEDDRLTPDTFHLVHAGGDLISRDLDYIREPHLCGQHGPYPASLGCPMCPRPAESEARA